MNIKNKLYDSYSHLKKLMVSFMAFISVMLLNPTVISAITYDNGKITASSTSGDTYGYVDTSTIGNTVFTKLATLISGFSGIALITLTLVFVIKCGQIAASADNAQKRSAHISGMGWLMISIAVLGFFTTSGVIMEIIVGLVNGNFL